MGVGYSASPLHCIRYLEPVEGAQERSPPAYLVPLLKHFDGIWDGRPTEFQSPAIADIVRWRANLSNKYRSQLGEDLAWDEESDFEKSEDAATSGDMLFRYVAAILDQQGSVGLRALVGTTKPSYPVLNAVFAEADRKGFSGRFPHLLLGARYWFPYKRRLIIEEPSWRGTVERYGSVFEVAEEIASVRDAIAAADPAVTAWTSDKPPSRGDIVAAAWETSDTVSRICAAAAARHLPFWTTG